MNTPKVIKIHNGVIIGEIGVISAIQNIKDMTYFSEEHIRQILREVVEDANHLIDISTTLHKTKLDADNYIPHVIDLLMKGGEE